MMKPPQATSSPKWSPRSSWTRWVLVSIGLLALAQPSLRAQSTDHGVEPDPHDDSVLIVSRTTAQLDGWKQVVSALRTFHRDRGVRTFVFDDSPLELQEAIAREHPRYLTLIASPEECTRRMVLAVNRLARSLDEDPWPDVEWGVVTGRDWSDAMRRVVTRDPLAIRRAAGVASLPIDAFFEVWCWDEAVAGRSIRTSPEGERVETITDASDMMPGIVASLNDYQPDLFFSSGRATQGDWRIGYAFQAGAFTVRDGALIGVGLDHQDHPVNSSNPKVWLAAGNCLVGDVQDRDSMALAIMASAGATQFLGYTGRTWHGRAGWGTSGWFLDEPQRHTLPEAVFFNQVQLIDELAQLGSDLPDLELGYFGPREDPRFHDELETRLAGRYDEAAFEQVVGHLWDRDALVLHGDPTWEARLDGRPSPWSIRLESLGENRWKASVQATEAVSFSVPPAWRFPWRMRIDSIEGSESAPRVLLADDFVCFTDLKQLDAGESRSVVFTGEPVRLRRRVHSAADPERIESQLARLPARYRAAVRRQLKRAGEHAGELVCAIERLNSPLELTSIGYLLAWMPERDLTTVDCGFLSEEVRAAARIREESRFCRALPMEVYLNEVLPYAFVGERREAWRVPLNRRFASLVHSAPTQAAAVRALNQELWRSYGIVYHPTKRPKTDQSPSETIDCGVASCTGLSIILASSLRSVGIPARLAGVPMWHDDSGNHTWVEVWDDGRWHYVEAFGGPGYGEAWWVDRATRAQANEPLYAVWATSWKPTGDHFPLEWDPEDQTIPAVNVTERYRSP